MKGDASFDMTKSADIEPDILKFEYMTQLLVDSSYIPLVLKLLQLQEIERVVAYRCDREELK